MRAAEALGGLGKCAELSEEVMQTLAEALANDKHEYVRKHAATALGQIGARAPLPEEFVNALVKALYKDSEWNVRMRAAEALGNLAKCAEIPDAVMHTLVQATKDDDSDVRRAAETALADINAAKQMRSKAEKAMDAS